MRSRLLESRQIFSELDFWPPQRAEINPTGWLEQFEESDRAIAEELLESFVFYNRRHTEQLFTSALLDLSHTAYAGATPADEWIRYRNNVLVSFPGTEDQNPTDSGHEFARIARKKFGLPQDNIYRPAELVRQLSKREESVSVLFVDDMLGSGDQFLECWGEIIYVDESPTSLEEELTRLDARVDFAVAVATANGLNEVKEHAPMVSVAAGSLLDPEASARHPLTRAVSHPHLANLEPFLTKYAERSGLAREDIWGHGEAGTTIAFDHGVPDTTLPIFWRSENWTPLRKAS